jgi:formate hydrogenlyase subunit 3/multisubunit Na+/H+ antiporter MnhD subunit
MNLILNFLEKDGVTNKAFLTSLSLMLIIISNAFFTGQQFNLLIKVEVVLLIVSLLIFILSGLHQGEQKVIEAKNDFLKQNRPHGK